MSKYFIITPPPNLTGSLHSGHILNLSLQEVIVRYCYHILNIKVDVIFGFDHAALYAEIVAKRQLNYCFTKETLLNKIHDNAHKNRLSILETLSRYSIDYNNKGNEIFTYSDNSKNIISRCYKKLLESKYKLINYDYRLCFYDFKEKTVLSDIEVQSKVVMSKLYQIKYYLLDNNFNVTSDYIVISTTRPDTIELDVVIVCHPKDKRYVNYIGMYVQNPITGNKLQILCSEYVIPEFGTGAVKVTPYFSSVDLDIMKQLGIQVDYHNPYFNLSNNMFTIKSIFYGLDIEQLIDYAIDYLKKQHMLCGSTNHETSIYIAIRNNNRVYQILQRQFFLDLDMLVKISKFDIHNLLVVGSKGKTDIRQFTLYLDTWCISRQNIYGHLIPSNNTQIKNYVLDTWFSSSLYPVLLTHIVDYSQDKVIVITAYDIMFFWIYKMFFMSNFIIGKQTIHSVIVHGLICDAKGEKVSKTKNNDIKIIFDKQEDHERFKVFLLLQKIFQKKILFDDSKYVVVDRAINKLYHIVVCVKKYKQCIVDINSFQEQDIFMRYIVSMLFDIMQVFVVKCFDDIICNIQNIIYAFEKLILFVKNIISNFFIVYLLQNEYLQYYCQHSINIVYLVLYFYSIWMPQSIKYIKYEFGFDDQKVNLQQILTLVKDYNLDRVYMKFMSLLIAIIKTFNVSHYKRLLKVNNNYFMSSFDGYYDQTFIVCSGTYVYFNKSEVEKCGLTLVLKFYHFVVQRYQLVS